LGRAKEGWSIRVTSASLSSWEGLRESSLSPGAANEEDWVVRRTDGARPAAVAVLVGALLAGCSTVAPLPQPTGSAVAGPEASASATATPSPAPDPTPEPTPAPIPDGDVLAKQLGRVSHSGIEAIGLVVMNPATSEVLTSRGDAPLVPASTMKVMTSLAAVDTLGEQATFATTVVSPAKGRLVLVGGGDPMLTDKQSKSPAKQASLQALAAQTVAALKESGTTSVRLGYDASLFSGPAYHPSWRTHWQGYTARVAALTINGARSGQWSVHADPAKTAAEAFAARLKAAGIKVTAIKPQAAERDAAVLAEVRSAPLAEIVGHTLRVSDNFVAEVLARQVALGSGRKGSFAAASQAVTAWLKDHDLWASGMVIDDGSGLSGKSRLRPSVLAQALSLVLVTPAWSSIAKGLPVAGVDGTLKDRFDDKAEKAGRTVVHAKTGTLLGVASLAGYVTTADGAVLTFALMANRSVGRDTAYNWLDRTASVLATCGCRAAG
jgi:D-alanyl-D-alanine carboxypeptidase/D-alanyl-D-alanine-endopeptidase (penicillin-binding protein 4)